MKTKTGFIIVIVRERGYGFIIANNNETKQKVFFHASDVQNIAFEDTQKGDRVSFIEMETEKGLKAMNVNVVK